MPSDFLTTLLVLLSFVCTFLLARYLSRNFRAKRRQREDAARRANETRQVRRARERRAK